MDSPIKVALLGATGKAGKYLLNELLNKGYQVRSLIRNPEKYTLTHPAMEIIKGDITDKEAALTLLKGCDVVISVIGQPKDEPLNSSIAATHITSAMKAHHIKRYIFVTGLNMDLPGDQKSVATQQATQWMKQTFPIVVADKEKALKIVADSNVDWTLVRLPWIEETEERRTLTVNLVDNPGEKISTTDLADFLISQITDNSFLRKGPFVASL